MQKQDGITTLIGIIIIVVVAIVAIGGVFAYQYFTKTTGWKTYTNTQYGFKIKYPNSMSPIVDNYSPKTIWLQQETAKVLITVDKEPYALLFQGTWAPAKYSEVGLIKVQSSKNIILNGVSFKKDYWSLQAGLKSITYSAKSGDQYYSIISGIDNPEDETVLDDMLSTFKFTNQTVTCIPEGGVIGAPRGPEDLCCAGLIKQPISADGSGTGSGTVGECVKPADQTEGWKTYTNTQYGFEFKYPSEFGNAKISPETVLDCNSQVYNEVGLVSFKNIGIHIACPNILNSVQNSPVYKGDKSGITIAGRQAYIFEYTSAVGYTNKEAYILLSSGDYLGIIHTFKSGRPADYLELSQIQWQNILSTIKFTK